MSKTTGFFAYDHVSGKRHRIASPPKKISRHVLRKREWMSDSVAKKIEQVKKRRTHRAKRKPAKVVTKVSDTISYNSDEFECLHCSRLGDDPLCTSKCHRDFTKQHLAPVTASIQIRGPSQLGYAAYTTDAIMKGQWIGEYVGELRPLSLSKTQKSHYWLEIPGKCAIDAEMMGNWTRFMNSSCEPNVKVWGEFLGKRHVVLFQALRDVEAGEELCFQYGRGYFEKAGFMCRCSAQGGEGHLPDGGGTARRKKRP